jgi:hypothetical protein
MMVFRPIEHLLVGYLTTLSLLGSNQLNTTAKPPTIGGMLLQQLIVFLVCVVFPGLVTAMAPATWITFERTAETVRCTTRTCVFFIVPYKVQQVDHVTAIDHHERAGKAKKERRFGRLTGKTINVHGEGFLQIEGTGDQLAEVSVSPSSMDSVVSQSNAFLTSTTPASTTIFTIANWTFGGLMGGFLTLLTVLYVVGYSLGFLNWVFVGVKGMFALPERSEAS